MDEAPNCEADSSAHPDTPVTRPPRGFAVRLSPAESPGAWADVFPLSDGRRGVVLGCCAEPTQARRLRAQLRKDLRHNADPARCLDGMDEPGASAVCAVIDATTLAYRAYGSSAAVVMPDPGPDDRATVWGLAPGATVLLCTASIPDAGGLLENGAALHPDQIADGAIALAAGSPAAAVVYRHPPEPMSLTLAAVPSNLAISRGRLRGWLAEAGVDAQSCADVLLAVGEATANAAEHAVLGAGHEVRLTVNATVSGNRLRLSVSDDGAWKPAAVSQNHRGHGLHLMSALVDSVELSATPGGTTVAMLKELP